MIARAAQTEGGSVFSARTLVGCAVIPVILWVAVLAIGIRPSSVSTSRLATLA